MDLQQWFSMRLSRRRAIRDLGILAGVGLPINAGIFAAHKVLATNFEKNFNLTQQEGLGEGLPGLKEVWDWQVFMNNLGPRYTGNAAHRAYVDFLDTQLKALGLDLVYDDYIFPRWEARRTELQLLSSNSWQDISVSSYYPYSGQTTPTGVEGELVYLGSLPEDGSPPENIFSADLKGKIALVDAPLPPMPLSKWYKVWGVYNPQGDTTFPATTLRVPYHLLVVPGLEKARMAGALGVIFAWTNVSEENAADQYLPFPLPFPPFPDRGLQDLPALWVGRQAGDRLRQGAETGCKVRLTLEADVILNSPTRTLIALLPGQSDEVIIVNTHTDGPNAIEENGGLALLALARYFAHQPRSTRKRTLAFALTTGHFASTYVPSIAGVILRHPDLILKTVAGLTIEHLGTREWVDDPSGQHYYSTGDNELAWAYCPLKPEADLFLQSLQGTQAHRVAVLNPVTGPNPLDWHWLGEGLPLYLVGIPMIAYIAPPNYLLAGPAQGDIDKVDPTRMYGEITAFAKTLSQLDRVPALALKGW